MRKGFTLIELLLVIVILGILAAFISANLFSSLKKSRDAKRKADLNVIKDALEMYYENNYDYPDGLVYGYPLVDDRERMYLKKVPQDPIEGCRYQYEKVESPKGWRLYSIIENSHDKGEGVKQEGYEGTDCGCGICKYMITSSNIGVTPSP